MLVGHLQYSLEHNLDLPLLPTFDHVCVLAVFCYLRSQESDRLEQFAQLPIEDEVGVPSEDKVGDPWLCVSKADAEKDEVGDYVVSDPHQNQTVSLISCFRNYVIALVFLAVYFNALLQGLQMTLMPRFYWILSLLVQFKFLSGDGSEMEEQTLVTMIRWTCCPNSVRKTKIWRLLMSENKVTMTDADGTSEKPMDKIGRAEAIVRFFMSYTSNGLFRLVILYTLPLYLASITKAPQDFALNAFGVTFIVDLDNDSSGRRYKSNLQEMNQAQVNDESVQE